MAINNLYSTTKQGANAVIPKNTAESTSYENTIGSEPTLKEKVDTLYSYFETFGSAKSASKWYNARLLSVNGTSYGNISIDGSKDINLTLKESTFVEGTQTTVTGAWKGKLHNISALYDGLTIRYWLPYNGSGNSTLELTLDNGSTTGPIACYYKGTSRLTTHYSAGDVIELTYRKNVSIAGSTTLYTGWWASANYDSNSDTKNTAGSTNNTNKLFLIGAASQAANPTTYSRSTCYIGTDGCLYSNGQKVATVSGDSIVTGLGYTPVNKAGDTMEGNLIMKNVTLNDGAHNMTIITAYDDGSNSNNGSELTIQGGGNTFVGSGESASDLRTKFQSGDLLTGESYQQTAENTYLTSDGSIYFYSGIQTITDRKGIIFDTNGALRPLATNTMYLGSTNYYWSSAYIKNINATDATFTGTLTLSKTTDLSGTADNGPALVIGGTRTTAHMEIDNNEIQAKSNGTTTATLNLNTDGGLVAIGSGGLSSSGNIYPSTAISKTSGTAALPWHTIYGRYFRIYGSANSGDYGRIDAATIGTANTSSAAGTVGIGRLVLGNNIAQNNAVVSDDNPASGANNAKGVIYLYGTNTGYTLLTPTNNTANNITLNLPSGGGTLARTTGDAVQYIKGTLTNPTSASTYYIPFHSGATTGNKALLNNNGFGIYSLEGTTSALGYDILFTGNNIASGTAGNKYGGVRLYGQGTYFTQIISGTPTANRTITLPDKSGTIALTSDALDMATKDGNGNIITDTYLPLSGGTMTGALNMNSQQITNVNTIYASNWFRSSGATGWYNTTYGGEIYQNDATWIKSNKAFYAEGVIRAASDIEAKIQVRLAGNSRGILLRNDDTYFWILICNSPYATYNNLRPLSIRLSDGVVTLGTTWCSGLYITGETWKRTEAGWHRYIYTSAEGDGHNITKLVAYTNYMECTWYGVQTYGVNWWASDKRLKTNIEDTKINALDLINKIECKSFDWKDRTKSSVRCGLISQQLEDIGLDDCIFKVKQSKDSQTYKDGIEEVYQIDDSKIIPYLIKGMQEMSTTIDNLIKKIEQLENV